MWRKFNKLLSVVFPSLILISFFALLVCFINQWDSLVWLTVIPIWFWAGIGVTASILSWIFFRSNAAIVTLCFYLGAGVIFSEETLYLLRDSQKDLLPTKDANEKAKERKIRIVTINCNDGKFNAALDVAPLKPDIVFLQECPLRPEISHIADEIFADDKTKPVFAMSSSRHGNAIIARGTLLMETIDKNAPTLHVRLRLPSNGKMLDLTNVNLRDCLPRFDLWKRSVRKKLTHARITNRRELRTYLSDYHNSKQQPGRIIAGDFSTPHGDDIFQFLKDAGLRDCFPISGKGWGNTFSSAKPFLRTDQIWLSPELIPVASHTVITPHSDHRILVCDFLIQSKK